MRKIIIAFSLLGMLAAPIAASALDLGTDRARRAAGQAGFDSATSRTTLAGTLGTVVKTALGMVGVIFMILIIYAGFLWMTARGNEQQVEKAETIIRSSVIGLIIVLGAYSITSFVVPALIERTTGG